jgi:hypothetical protein
MSGLVGDSAAEEPGVAASGEILLITVIGYEKITEDRQSWH